VIRRPLWLAGIAAVGIGAVGAALVSQHVYGMQPCPWCVLQRVIFLAIAAAALLALVLPGLLRGLFLLVLTALAASGVAAAVWQHFVAASAASCNLTLADRIGLPYEAWSGLLFAVMALIGLRMLLGKPGRRR
jgi:protein dithiol:quinone oxidoreductase